MKRFTVSFQGDLYLAAIKDLWNREIGSYAMSHRTTQDLPGRAPLGAVTAKRPPAGLVHHSDRGSQYCSLSYQELLKQFGMVSSMCRKGTSYDNAPMENFFGTLKSELVRHRKYHTRQEAMAEIFESLECIIQLAERHASLGNIFPSTFKRKYFSRQGAAWPTYGVHYCGPTSNNYINADADLPRQLCGALRSQRNLSYSLPAIRQKKPAWSIRRVFRYVRNSGAAFCRSVPIHPRLLDKALAEGLGQRQRSLLSRAAIERLKSTGRLVRVAPERRRRRQAMLMLFKYPNL